MTINISRRPRRWRLRWRRSVAVQWATSTCRNVAPDWLARCRRSSSAGGLYVEDALSSASRPVRRVHLLHLEFSTDVAQISHVVHDLRLRLKRNQSQSTSLCSCRRWTRATCCVTPIVLYTTVDAECDKLATDDGRTALASFATVFFYVQSLQKNSRNVDYAHVGTRAFFRTQCGTSRRTHYAYTSICISVSTATYLWRTLGRVSAESRTQKRFDQLTTK